MPIGNPFESRESFAARKNGELWILPIGAIDPTGADDNFAYLKNDEPAPIEVSEVQLASTVAGIVKMEKCTGTASGGTAVNPINTNGNSGKAPAVTFETGVDITGLTDAGVLGTIGLGANLEGGSLSPKGPIIILKKDEAVLLNWSAATGVLTGTIRIMRAPEKD